MIEPSKTDGFEIRVSCPDVGDVSVRPVIPGNELNGDKIVLPKPAVGQRVIEVIPRFFRLRGSSSCSLEEATNRVPVESTSPNSKLVFIGSFS